MKTAYRICLHVSKVIYPIGNILEHIIACRAVGRLQSVRQKLPRVLLKLMKSVLNVHECILSTFPHLRVVKNQWKNRYTVPMFNTELLVTVAVIGMIPFLIAIVFMYFVVFIVIACKEGIWSLNVQTMFKNFFGRIHDYWNIENSQKEIESKVW